MIFESIHTVIVLLRNLKMTGGRWCQFCVFFTQTTSKMQTVLYIWTVLGSDQRSDRKSACKLIGSDRRPDAVIIHSETTQLVTILLGHFKNIHLNNLTH